MKDKESSDFNIFFFLTPRYLFKIILTNIRRLDLIPSKIRSLMQVMAILSVVKSQVLSVDTG